jgi:hypothetical protein
MPVTHSWVVNEDTANGTADGWCKCGWSASGDAATVHREANDTDNH